MVIFQIQHIIISTFTVCFHELVNRSDKLDNSISRTALRSPHLLKSFFPSILSIQFERINCLIRENEYMSQCMRKGVLWHNVIIRRKRHKHHQHFATSAFSLTLCFHEELALSFQYPQWMALVLNFRYVYVLIYKLTCMK